LSGADPQPLWLDARDADGARGAVILLHGLGANHEDLVPLADGVSPDCRDRLTFVVPRAPLRRITIAGGLTVPAWFDIHTYGDNGEEDWRGLDETRAALLSITGIGPWTFEMFAIFYLKHPDVLPLGDLGLVNAMEQQYNGGRRLADARLRTIAARWEPWRTVATWYLWRSIDPEPVVYPGPAADA